MMYYQTSHALLLIIRLKLQITMTSTYLHLVWTGFFSNTSSTLSFELLFMLLQAFFPILLASLLSLFLMAAFGRPTNTMVRSHFQFLIKDKLKLNNNYKLTKFFG